MNSSLCLLVLASAFLVSISEAAPPQLSLQPGVELSWPTLTGATYQARKSALMTGPWSDIGGVVAGDGSAKSLFDAAAGPPPFYQVLEVLPGAATSLNSARNGSYEDGVGVAAAEWSRSGNQPPSRIGSDVHSGTMSMRCLLANVGSLPSEGLLSQTALPITGPIFPAGSYTFSFWAKQLAVGPSYVQQYEVQWLSNTGAVIGGTSLTNFSVPPVWSKITAPVLAAPANAASAVLRFRFVTGAVAGGGGELLLDDVEFSTPGPTTMGTTQTLAVSTQPVYKVGWEAAAGVSYLPQQSTDLRSWSSLGPAINGSGGPAAVMLPQSGPRGFVRLAIPLEDVAEPLYFRKISQADETMLGLAWQPGGSANPTGYEIRYGTSPTALDTVVLVGNVSQYSISGLVAGTTYWLSLAAIGADGETKSDPVVISATPGGGGGMVELYNAQTLLEPATTEETPTALVTRLSDRGRDRHAREGNFAAYDHYLTWYWEERTIGIEIIDHVAKGGTGITFNYQTLTPLGAPEFRAFFRGINTVAEYYGNYSAALVGPNLYSQTLTTKLPEGRPLQIGDYVEIEISQFMLAPTHGRNNYYGTTMLYVVGQGIVPWQGVGPLLDSAPLPQSAWLGGKTTLPYQYSNEPADRYKQTAGNISPLSAQPFMLGRRLHHTDFSDGSHSEPGNPLFTEHAGKLGPKFIAKSCVECHVNNGRALRPAIGSAMLKTVVKVGADAIGSPHPQLGSVLQPQATVGGPEGVAKILSYLNTGGTYADGTSYSLQKPIYGFVGVTPNHFSARLAPPLVGMGLLEAIPENDILALADPTDADADGISGRARAVTDPVTGELRLGRFTAKASQATITHQIAAALNTDMGVTTSIFPTLDGTAVPVAPELGSAELAKMTRYVALLGVGAQRDLADPAVPRGAMLFNSLGCAKCHTPEFTTSAFAPFTELRSQTIHPYTDLLLHDMGSGLADNMGEEDATGSEWRTPPLWGIGLSSGVSGGESYLHDGRARNLSEAILWHGGEGSTARDAFKNLPFADREDVLKFLKSL